MGLRPWIITSALVLASPYGLFTQHLDDMLCQALRDFAVSGDGLRDFYILVLIPIVVATVTGFICHREERSDVAVSVEV